MDYKVRRDSLITPWGVGAIIPFPHDESLMVAGIDYWFNSKYDYHNFIIIDERLSKRLGGKSFVMPPDFREYNQDSDNAEIKIPAVRFPRWHYCPICGNMEQIGEAGDRKRCPGDIRRRSGKETYCSKKPYEKRSYMIPERFIAVCEDGHIEDFPVMEWVHKRSDKPIKPDCKLYRSTGGDSSSLSGIRYTCTCGASANMQGAFSKEALDRIGYRCTGNRPWLGEENKEDCGKSLLVLQRGASNVWFANIISSIYIPWIPKYKNGATKDCINRGVEYFKSNLKDGKIDIDGVKTFVQAQAMWSSEIDVDAAVTEIIETLNETDKPLDETEDGYRLEEFKTLINTVGASDQELYVKSKNTSEYDNLWFLKSVSLVHKLRETRVFTGFCRISPENRISNCSLNNLQWLPAVKNSGEGLMFNFDLDKLNAWASSEKVKNRVGIIEANLKATERISSSDEINPVYVLLHTFAHCLINALSNESGYSNASIREKIYCSKMKDDKYEMAGVLIYTASGDSEGSLGGLVRQGLPGRIEPIIQRALLEAKWCASDPVCIQSPGQGQDGCNLAACHNCVLLPETSCENKNMLLDRGLLIGTLEDTSIGFFGD